MQKEPQGAGVSGAVAVLLLALLLAAGCEFSGSYRDDGTAIEFGTTNRTVQGEAQ